ncbi:CsbD family protein [Pseudoroseicyclus aestuarii]|uniref:CsbD-like protein n=1 Tax=Pseudoroseicyclus aestuarii TaxID=1795041 RepID=A0A318SQR3_9RHOB|nr:CsbD family protein [Pseudoroseicyclus aestuarii]PYE84261.1 CsbD-like protein [Pseudoroseicyclus aestuarii]
MANEDQVKGKTKDIGGKVKEEFGDATNNQDLKTEGQADQVEGKVQKTAGDVEEKLKD